MRHSRRLKLHKKTRKIRKRSTIRRRRYKQSGGDLNAFKSKLDASNSSLVLLGRGGAGSVYLDPEQPDIVFKVGNRSQTCRIWGKEQKIYQAIGKYSIDTDLVKLLKMNQFNMYNNESRCILELSRVVNPINSSADYTVQVQFGVNSVDYKDKARGRFLGLSQLKQERILSDTTISEYVKQLGTVIGSLHFIAKNDGYDLELFAGVEDGKTVLYIGDFDLSEMIQDYGKEEIERMAWALGAVPYFPTLDQEELYEVFKNAYLEVAENQGKRDIGEAVLEKYVL